jgi:hypothetical protein
VVRSTGWLGLRRHWSVGVAVIGLVLALLSSADRARGASLASSPSAVTAPRIVGTPAFGQPLTADPGTWTNDPTSFNYEWLRCDANGTRCLGENIDDVSTYTPVAADIAKILVLRVFAHNAVGAGVSESYPGVLVPRPPLSPPAGFDSLVSDSGCDDCTVTPASGGGFIATVGAGVDQLDTAYALRDFGGVAGAAGRRVADASLLISSNSPPLANLALMQVRDVNDALVWELYVSPDQTLHLWSPAGGLDANAINATTSTKIPIANDQDPPRFATPLQVEVSALANDSVVVKVGGVTAINLSGLGSATTGRQRYLRAGIDHYDSTSAFETMGIYFRDVSVAAG